MSGYDGRIDAIRNRGRVSTHQPRKDGSFVMGLMYPSSEEGAYKISKSTGEKKRVTKLSKEIIDILRYVPDWQRNPELRKQVYSHPAIRLTKEDIQRVDWSKVPLMDSHGRKVLGQGLMAEVRPDGTVKYAAEVKSQELKNKIKSMEHLENPHFSVGYSFKLNDSGTKIASLNVKEVSMVPKPFWEGTDILVACGKDGVGTIGVEDFVSDLMDGLVVTPAEPKEKRSEVVVSHNVPIAKTPGTKVSKKELAGKTWDAWTSQTECNAKLKWGYDQHQPQRRDKEKEVAVECSKENPSEKGSFATTLSSSSNDGNNKKKNITNNNNPSERLDVTMSDSTGFNNQDKSGIEEQDGNQEERDEELVDPTEGTDDVNPEEPEEQQAQTEQKTKAKPKGPSIKKTAKDSDELPAWDDLKLESMTKSEMAAHLKKALEKAEAASSPKYAQFLRDDELKKREQFEQYKSKFLAGGQFEDEETASAAAQQMVDLMETAGGSDKTAPAHKALQAMWGAFAGTQPQTNSAGGWTPNAIPQTRGTVEGGRQGARTQQVPEARKAASPASKQQSPRPGILANNKGGSTTNNRNNNNNNNKGGRSNTNTRDRSEFGTKGAKEVDVNCGANPQMFDGGTKKVRFQKEESNNDQYGWFGGNASRSNFTGGTNTSGGNRQNMRSRDSDDNNNDYNQSKSRRTDTSSPSYAHDYQKQASLSAMDNYVSVSQPVLEYFRHMPEHMAKKGCTSIPTYEPCPSRRRVEPITPLMSDKKTAGYAEFYDKSEAFLNRKDLGRDTVEVSPGVICFANSNPKNSDGTFYAQCGDDYTDFGSEYDIEDQFPAAAEIKKRVMAKLPPYFEGRSGRALDLMALLAAGPDVDIALRQDVKV